VVAHEWELICWFGSQFEALRIFFLISRIFFGIYWRGLAIFTFMKKIGLLSDTHGSLPEKVFDFFAECDEIWHAGDAGNIELLEKLAAFKPLKAVYGNIDDHKVRASYPEHNIFMCEDVKVCMIHIGGYPGRYSPTARKIVEEERPGLFISGHSHILKAMPDKKYQLLHLNPGAAGKQGLHRKITMMRFEIEGKEIRNLEIFDKDR
jgi:putative phosphoesterase